MSSRQLLSRLFKSQWTRVFGPALILLELLGFAAAVVTGDWSLTWVVPLLIAAFFLRAFLIVFLFLSPVFVAAIVLWAALTHSKKKQQKKANLEPSTGKGTATSEITQ